ncbi:MAG: substrate-binding domain-containing protein [Gammaproteobacteria bacterium]|nr:substrate-binding domain-containing protein [Gammaproteobacteria bacterium]
MIRKLVFLFIIILPLKVIAEPSKLVTPYKVGVLYWSMDIPGQVIMREGIEAVVDGFNLQARKNNSRTIKLIPRVAGNGDEGIERQIIQMDELINQKVDVLIVQPADNAALSKPLLRANALGIPVVAYDQYISSGKLHSFITSDNYQAGYLGGEYIASKFDNDEIIKIVLVDYPHVSSTVSRVDGFFDALARQNQPYNILTTYEAVEPVAGTKVANQLLNDFPETGSVDVVFTVNDGGGLSIVKALVEAKRDEIMLATVDGDPESIEYLRQGQVTVIDSAQFCGAIGKEAILTVIDLLSGRKVASQKLIPVFPVTKETIQFYPGWQGKIPEEFIKPWKSKTPLWTGDVVSKIVVK